MLCTWDRLHLSLREQESVNWDVLDPVVLGDVLALAAPVGDDVRLISPTVVALTLSNAEAARGAAVWDFLARTERERLNDAALRDRARAFKDSWVERESRNPRSRDIQRAWESWKAAHPLESSTPAVQPARLRLDRSAAKAARGVAARGVTARGGQSAETAPRRR